MNTDTVRATNQALASGLAELTSGVVEGKEAVDTEAAPLESSEMIQRVQVPADGIASHDIVFTEIDVTWPYPIINQVAGNQHESTQETPHFNYGVELTTDEHVILEAIVRGWHQDESDFYTGAHIRISAWAPGTPKTIAYKAVLHLTFMGYAAAAEDDDDAINPDHEVA